MVGIQGLRDRLSAVDLHRMRDPRFVKAAVVASSVLAVSLGVGLTVAGTRAREDKPPSFTSTDGGGPGARGGDLAGDDGKGGGAFTDSNYLLVGEIPDVAVLVNGTANGTVKEIRSVDVPSDSTGYRTYGGGSKSGKSGGEYTSDKCYQWKGDGPSPSGKGGKSGSSGGSKSGKGSSGGSKSGKATRRLGGRNLAGGSSGKSGKTAAGKSGKSDGGDEPHPVGVWEHVAGWDDAPGWDEPSWDEPSWDETEGGWWGAEPGGWWYYDEDCEEDEAWSAGEMGTKVGKTGSSGSKSGKSSPSHPPGPEWEAPHEPVWKAPPEPEWKAPPEPEWEAPPEPEWEPPPIDPPPASEEHWWSAPHEPEEVSTPVEHWSPPSTTVESPPSSKSGKSKGSKSKGSKSEGSESKSSKVSVMSPPNTKDWSSPWSPPTKDSWESPPTDPPVVWSSPWTPPVKRMWSSSPVWHTSMSHR